MQQEHNYMKKIRRMVADGQIPAEAGLSHLSIRHDDWCGIFKGGVCNCDPEITYFRPVDRGANKARLN